MRGDVFDDALRESRGLLLELAYALNDVYDLNARVDELEGRVGELETELDDHEFHSCEENASHDDCVDAGEYEDLEAQLAARADVASRLKDWRERLYWDATRSPQAAAYANPFIAEIDRILEEPS